MKDNDKGLKVLVVILLLVIIGLGGYIVYDKTLKEVDNNVVDKANGKKDEGSVNDTVIMDNDAFSYTMVDTGTIGVVVNKNDKIFITYPQINYDNDAINTLNNVIKSNVNKTIDAINNHYDAGNETSCEVVKLTENNRQIAFEHLVYNKYYIYNTDKHLTIIEFEVARTTCASGYVNIVNTYVIDKNTKEVLYNDDLKALVNKDDLIKTIEKSETSKNNKKRIEDNDFYVYYNSLDNIVVAVNDVDSPNYSFYSSAGGSYSESSSEEAIYGYCS